MKRILSIEAGGMKGIIPVTILEYLETHLDIRIADYFDLMAGTSTGGILVAGLAAGIPARDMRGFYEVEGPKIFKQRWWHPTSLRGIFGATYSPKHLVKVLGNLLGDTRMKDLQTRLIIPSVTTQGNIAVFKTPHLKEHYLDGDKTVRDILLSSVSAPLYFPAHESTDHVCYTDGALWAPNPVICALTEGIKYMNWEKQDMRVLNLGSGDEPLNASRNMGKLNATSDVVPLIMTSLVRAANNNAELLMGEWRDNIVRISPDINLGNFGMDTVDAGKLREMRSIAADAARDAIDEIEPLFFRGEAEKFAAVI